MGAYDLDADRNVMEVSDKLSGQTFELYYRMPTNAERVAYDSAVTKRKGSQIKLAKDWMITQAKVGLRLCVGFKKGNFAKAGQLISSETGDADYFPEWKQLLFKVRPDILAHLTRTIFAALNDQETVDIDDEDAGTIEDLLDPDKFDFDDGDAAAASPAVSTSGATEATPAVNP